MAKNREDRPGKYLGARVYVEAFGRKRWGVVCSVYRNGEDVEVEVEWNDGQMDVRPMKALHLANEVIA